MPANIRATIPKVAAPAQIPPNAVPSQYWGSANGQRIISGTLSLPLYGAWVADLVLQTTTPLSGPVTLLVGNLTLVGAVYRQAVFAGLLECRLVAGAGGWAKSVGAVGYNNPAGVQASQVLSDAAAAVGETVVVAVPSTVGNQFARFGDSPTMPGKAGRVLRSVAGQQWWIDAAGVTHVGPRPSMAISSPFTVEEFHGSSGTLRIATEDPASWLPGSTFSSATVATQTIASVRHVFGADGVARLEVMLAGASEPWIESIRELIRQEIAGSVPYAMTYDYVVTATTGSTIDALPADPTRGAPPLTGVPFRCGVPGGSATLTPGTHVGIAFLDGNPGKPVLAGAIDSTTAQIVGVSGVQVNIGAAPTDGIVLQTSLAAQLSALANRLAADEALSATMAAQFAAAIGPMASLGPAAMAPLTAAVTAGITAYSAAAAIPNYSLTCKASK
ncbi:MAG: hypothetical protein WBY94_22105 [Polyangiaceae bacterium]